MTPSFIAAAALVLMVPALASAQWAVWSDRVRIGINGAAQLTTSTVDDRFEYDHPYGAERERAIVETEYEVPRGVMFDGGAAVRISGGLGVGVTVTAASSTNDLRVIGRVPHPFYFGRLREVEGSVAARRRETGVHVQAVYVVPFGSRFQMAISAGPSRFSVEHRVARSVTVSESFPFDTAAFADAPLETLKSDAWGFNVGADLGWMFTRHFGLGGVVRFTRASVTLSPEGREAFDVDAGGVQVGGGARVAF
jgi:hypothetical protein